MNHAVKHTLTFYNTSLRCLSHILVISLAKNLRFFDRIPNTNLILEILKV